MIEERISQLSKVIKWHKAQLKVARGQRQLYECLAACQGTGAILLEMGPLAQLVERDEKFSIRARGTISCRAETACMVEGRRYSDWDFDLQTATTTFSLDQTYTFATLPYSLYIPELSLDDVDEICDASCAAGQTSVVFSLPCMLVQTDQPRLEEFLATTNDEKSSLLTSMKSVFEAGHQRLSQLSPHSTE